MLFSTLVTFVIGVVAFETALGIVNLVDRIPAVHKLNSKLDALLFREVR